MTEAATKPAPGLAQPSVPQLIDAIMIIANGGLSDRFANGAILGALRQLRRHHGSLAKARKAAELRDTARNLAVARLNTHITRAR